MNTWPNSWQPFQLNTTYFPRDRHCIMHNGCWRSPRLVLLRQRGGVFCYTTLDSVTNCWREGVVVRGPKLFVLVRPALSSCRVYHQGLHCGLMVRAQMDVLFATSFSLVMPVAKVEFRLHLRVLLWFKKKFGCITTGVSLAFAVL